MQTLTLEIQESVSENFLWLLSHFQSHEVSIISQSRIEFLNRSYASQKDMQEGKVIPFDLETLIKKVG